MTCLHELSFYVDTNCKSPQEFHSAFAHFSPLECPILLLFSLQLPLVITFSTTIATTKGRTLVFHRRLRVHSTRKTFLYLHANFYFFLLANASFNA